jgi:hypothetical protein
MTFTSAWPHAPIPAAKPLPNLLPPQGPPARFSEPHSPIPEKCLQFRFLQITESVEYFLPLVRPKRGQEIQDFSFAHAKSLRLGTPKDKRSR